MNLEWVWKRAGWAGLALWFGCVLALGGVGIGRLTSLLSPALDLPDFGTYYITARALEVCPSAIYDDTSLNVLHAASDVPNCPLPYSYPPFFAAAIRPLAWLPYQQAATIWIALNITWLFGGLIGLLALTGWPGKYGGALTALLLLLLFVPAQEAVTLGQVTPLLFLLGALSLLLLTRPRSPGGEVVAGMLLGVATSIKVVPVVLMIYLLLRRRWLAVAGGVIAAVLCVVVGLLWGGGWANTWAYFTTLLPSMYTARLTRVDLDNQSLTALFLRPLGDGPVSRCLGLGAVLTVLLLTWLVPFVRHPKRLAHEFALISMLFLLVPSSVYGHMYVLALLPLALMVQSWCNGVRWVGVPSLLSFLLLIGNSYSRWLGLRVATWVPFGLVGALVIWSVLLCLVIQKADGCDLESG